MNRIISDLLLYRLNITLFIFLENGKVDESVKESL